jgi:lysophospholipase L1-like esterase
MSGFNDNTVNIPSYTDAAEKIAVTATLAALATALPNTPVVVTSGQSAQQVYPLENNAIYTRSRAILEAASVAPNVIATIDMTNTESWITGTGKVGATTASGNSNFLVSSDGAHPSDEGHEFYAEKIKPILRRTLIAA